MKLALKRMMTPSQSRDPWKEWTWPGAMKKSVLSSTG